MAGRREGQGRETGIDDADEGRYHRFRRFAPHGTVHGIEDRDRIALDYPCDDTDCLANVAHDDGRIEPVAGHIADRNDDSSAVECDCIVPVAADFRFAFGGTVDRIERQAVNVGHVVRQERSLQGRRDAMLALVSALDLGLGALPVLDIGTAAEPLRNRAVGCSRGKGATEKPAIRPSWRFKRYSVSKIAPNATASRHASIVDSKSSGCATACNECTLLGSIPVYSYHRRLRYVLHPVASATHTICGNESARLRKTVALLRTAASAFLRSSMSVTPPYQRRTAPDASNIGLPRATNQR